MDTSRPGSTAYRFGVVAPPGDVAAGDVGVGAPTDPGGHGSDAAFGVAGGSDFAPGPVPGVVGESGMTVEFGVDTVCPGVVGDGGLCALTCGGAPALFAEPGVPGRAAAVPVPVPAGMHGSGLGKRGGGVVVGGTVRGATVVGGTVVGGTVVGCTVVGGIVVGGTVVGGTVVGCTVVGGTVVGGTVGGAGEFCAAMLMADTASATTNAVEMVSNFRFMAQLLRFEYIRASNACRMPPPQSLSCAARHLPCSRYEKAMNRKELP